MLRTGPSMVGVCSRLLFYSSWWLFWSVILLFSRARDYPHVGFMWPILAIKSNWWDKEPDVGWRRRLMWQLEIVRMRRGKSLGSSHSFTHSLITSPSPSSPPFLMDGTPTLRSGLHIQGCDTGAHPAVSRAAKWHACHFHWQTRSSAYPRSSAANARHDCILMEPRRKQDSAAEINTSWAMRSDLEDRGVVREGQRALMHRDTWVTALFSILSAILDFWDEILSLASPYD